MANSNFLVMTLGVVGGFQKEVTAPLHLQVQIAIQTHLNACLLKVKAVTAAGIVMIMAVHLWEKAGLVLMRQLLQPATNIVWLARIIAGLQAMGNASAAHQLIRCHARIVVAET